MDKQLMTEIESTGVVKETAVMIHNEFEAFISQAKDMRGKALALVVTDESQVLEMAQAREARLVLKNLRVAADKKRKELKEDSLRYGRAVQGVYNLIEAAVKPLEDHLYTQENFAAIQEEKRKAERREVRAKEVEPLREWLPYNIDLGELSDEDYAKMLNGAKLQMQAEQDRIKKEEEDRIAREKAEAEERERIRQENERLKAEAEAREKELAAERARVDAERKAAEDAARKEREAAEAKIKAEQEAARQAAEKAAKERAELEAKIKAKEDAERREREEREAKEKAEAAAKAKAEKAVRLAPDKDKLAALAKTVSEIEMPSVKSDEAFAVTKQVDELLKKVVIFINERSAKL